MDLRTWNFEKDGPVELAGERAFYWQKFQDDIKPADKPGYIHRRGGMLQAPVLDLTEPLREGVNKVQVMQGMLAAMFFVFVYPTTILIC